MYANNYIIFEEIRHTENGDKSEDMHKIKVVNINTKSSKTLSYDYLRFFAKLRDGRIFIESDSDLIFNPYTGKIEEGYKLTPEDKAGIVYSTADEWELFYLQ